MQKLFTLLMAWSLVGSLQAAGTFQSGLGSAKHTKQLRAEKARLVPNPQLKPAKASFPILKSGSALPVPASAELQQWDGSAWVWFGQEFYDAQNRVIESVYDYNREVYTYDDVAGTVTKTQYFRDTPEGEWLPQWRELQGEEGVYHYEHWSYVDGDWVQQEGSKSEETETVDGLVATREYAYWSFNSGSWVKSSSYREVTERNTAGKVVLEQGYNWVDEQWVLEWSDSYTYNSGILEEIAYCENNAGVQECSREVFVYDGATQPEAVYLYESVDGVEVFVGRYTELAFINWEEMEVSYALGQKVLDSEGDLEDPDNYENYEKVEFTSPGNGSYFYWVNGAWMEYGSMTTVDNGDGTTTTTEIYFDEEGGIDDDCDVYWEGDKYIETSGPTFEANESYNWVKTGADCGSYDWVLSYKEEESTTATSFSRLNVYPGETADSFIEDAFEQQKDEWGTILSEISTYSVDGTITSYSEVTFDPQYEAGKLVSKISNRRDDPEGAYTLEHKWVYAYSPTTQIPEFGQEAAVAAYPSVFDQQLTVGSPTGSLLTLRNVQGMVVWSGRAQKAETVVGPVNQSPGLYLLQVDLPDGSTKVLKLLKL